VAAPRVVMAAWCSPECPNSYRSKSCLESRKHCESPKPRKPPLVKLESSAGNIPSTPIFGKVAGCGPRRLPRSWLLGKGWCATASVTACALSSGSIPPRSPGARALALTAREYSSRTPLWCNPRRLSEDFAASPSLGGSHFREYPRPTFHPLRASSHRDAGGFAGQRKISAGMQCLVRQHSRTLSFDRCHLQRHHRHRPRACSAPANRLVPGSLHHRFANHGRLLSYFALRPRHFRQRRLDHCLFRKISGGILIGGRGDAGTHSLETGGRACKARSRWPRRQILSLSSATL
jgi:hypothetical protein